MVTPFHPDGSVDTDGARRLVDHLAANGSDGVVVAGTTGEAPTLTDDEQIDLIELVVRHSGDRLFVIAGAGANDTAHAVRLTQRSANVGAQAILSVVPYYNRPNVRGIREHFGAVAQASDLPVILYNVPTRTGTDLDDSLAASVAADNPTIVAIKQARAGSPSMIDGLDLFAGNDDSFADALDVGAAGGILVASHLVGKQMRRMIDEPEQRRSIDSQLRDFYAALSVTSNPIPIKAALAIAGLPSGPLRLPLVNADTEELAVIERSMSSLELV
jgi:4-hydroxy-tetrahydrodipicolinate synthase